MKISFLILLLTCDLAWSQVNKPSKKQFTRIWIKTEIIPVNFSWNDLGLTKEASFTLPIAEAWKKWISENLPSNVEDVENCGEDCLSYLEEWEKKSSYQISTFSRSEYSNGVLLKVDLNVWKEEEPIKSGNAFRWEGRVILLDINTKRLLGSVTLLPQERHFKLEGAQANSAFGSQIYRTPLSAFVQLSKVLGKDLLLNQVARVKIIGHRHVLDAVAVMKLLQTRGSHLGLVSSLRDFNLGEAQLLCFFQGEEKSFSDLLSQLKELKSSESYTLVNQTTGPGHVIQLVTE